ncbi:HAD family hydrolase [Draconibacterium sp. IB214405]|uniref:HAD family hydrolase n=1 Tax=Draconibacterium sp. IB214405 TaxID=3097352 RepID=UPI002A14E1C0|nr:HAD family hydrolase [Draconibacterium sp. IB214405]MDX8340485.1 HAD family hydrolase [Draconibacterium sp. IB214405]
MKTNFKVIAFDADDTLWVNETFFRETEEKFCALLSDYSTSDETMEVLFATEMQNLEEYGYGTKGFVLSMIETALKITGNKVPQQTLAQIIELGKTQINQPVELLDGIIETLEYLKAKGYKLIVATKGDLLDQERKLQKSQLEKYFHHVEVMSNKKRADYQKLIRHLEIDPEDFLMIGNSYKSDIEPVVQLGGFGIHIPFHITWIHEKTDEMEEHPNWIKLNTIKELGQLL